MTEELHIKGADKAEIYASLLPQIKALSEGESDQIAALANVTAALRQGLGFFWIGFYLVKNGELVLGPFQGTVACTRIQKGKGVCGQAWEQQKTQIVPDVDLYPGHIACSSFSRSEIVVPIIKNGEVLGVLDVDSVRLNEFDENDQQNLESLCQWLAESIF